MAPSLRAEYRALSGGHHHNYADARGNQGYAPVPAAGSDRSPQ